MYYSRRGTRLPMINQFSPEIEMQIKYKPSIVSTIQTNKEASHETRQQEFYFLEKRQ